MNKQYTERFLLTKTYTPHATLCTYEGKLKTCSVQKVLKYHLQYLDAKTKERQQFKKLDVMFAINADTLEQVKAGIRIDKAVKAQNLRTPEKVKDRLVVLTKENLHAGKNRDVRIVMRSGHVLRGRLIEYSQYTLVLDIVGMVVLVYKHGVLEYSVTPQQQNRQGGT